MEEEKSYNCCVECGCKMSLMAMGTMCNSCRIKESDED